MTEFGPASLALLVLALPLVAAVTSALLGTRPRLAHLAHWPTIVAFAVAAGGAGMALYQLAALTPGATVAAASQSLPWFHAGNVSADFAVSLDPLSAVMLLTITFVATWIAIFSSSYMKGDAGFARYFALMGLFVFSMCLLVLADNFLLMVAGWEGVGLCSYLLVGYYYAKPSAAAAARKAFLVTRLGDVGMILGIFWLWSIGDYRTNFHDLFEFIARHPETHGDLNAACLLLFCGAVGKSAQLPLYVWLPDAMEGPTPVSALIHAATMVTAGVYLLARCAPLFALAPVAQIVVCTVAGLTALLAGFLALAQNDLKRVLAYSTVSQLGFMFLALGTGGVVTPSVAVTAALFHLVTHAFFKALLFLGSGSVMHAMGDVIDMRRFGGLRRLMPTTHATFLVGALALAGVVPFAGFWSKDAILDTLFEAAESQTRFHGGYLALLGVALVTAGLTAFYTFRAYFLTFAGELRTPEEAGHHAHESPAAMTVPLIVLALGALLLGVALEPATHAFSTFLARTPGLALANELAPGHGHAAHGAGPVVPHLNYAIAGISTAVALLGVFLAWQNYGRGGPEVVPAGMKGVYALSRNKLYVDELYGAAFVKPAEVLAAGSRQVDGVLDSLAQFISALPRFVAAVLRPLHNGLVQFYALSMVLGLGVFLAVVMVRSTR